MSTFQIRGHNSRSNQQKVEGARRTLTNQNAYIELFNGRLRDECLNEHWIVSLNHAQVVIRAWAREYNEERPKKALGGLTPVANARQLAAKAITSTQGL